MRKNDNKTVQKPFLMPLAARILRLGMLLIYLSLFRLILEITAAAPFTEAAAKRFGSMLEYPVAALMLLTASAFLIDRVLRCEDT